MHVDEHPSLGAQFAAGSAPSGGLLSQITVWNHDAMIAASLRTFERLRSVGVNIPIQNRLQSSVDFLRRAQRFHVNPGIGDPATEAVMAECRRTIMEMHTVAARLRAQSDPAVVRKLEAMLGGPQVAVKGSFDKARDTQAEFFAAALFGAAGYWVTHAEPDLVIHQTGISPLGVAVKRVTSDAQYRKRVQKAQDQLETQQLDGFIVVNAQRFLTDEYSRNRNVDISAALYRKVSSWVAHLRPSANLRVLGIVVIGTSFCTTLGSSGSRTTGRLHFNPILVAMPDEVARLSNVEKALGGMARAMDTAHRLDAQRVDE